MLRSQAKSTMSVLSKNLKIALLQFHAGADKAANLAKFEKFAHDAVKKDSSVDLLVLPECFNSPYDVSAFRQYSENIPEGETTKTLSKVAKELKVFLVGGSFPELSEDGSKVYNTSLTFNPEGEIIAKHRKAHLFDIDIPDKITFKESITLTSGDKATLFNIGDFGKVGLGICYDMRFPELAIGAARKGAFAMIYPGAFNTTTGPLHWELLARARAVDNQVFVVLCSPARQQGGYQAYGHSLVVDPMGKVLAEAGEGEEIVICELDPSVLESARAGIPVTTQRKFDIYDDIADHMKFSDL